MPCKEARALVACSRLRQPQRVPGRREDAGADELPGTDGWFFVCSGRGTETLATLAGYILLLGRCLSGLAHPRVSTLPKKMCVL